MIDQITIPPGNTDAVWQAPQQVHFLQVTDVDPGSATVTFHRNSLTEIEFDLDAPIGEAVVVHFRWN